MITVKGNVLDIEEGIIVHGCNGHGVMGAGIALQIKNRFPNAFEVYAESNLKLGSVSVAKINDRKFIANAITQKSTGFGKQVSYDAIEECFIQVVRLHEIIQEKGHFLPICFPMIGAGLGGGNWNVIEKIIDETVPKEIFTFLYVL